MNTELFKLADETRMLYRMGEISKAEAIERMQPYIDHFNETSKRLAKKYNQKAQKFSFASFMR